MAEGYSRETGKMGVVCATTGPGATNLITGICSAISEEIPMLVITALVGTRDLGQEVYIALTKADTGRGLVAGLCVAAIAIIADRLIQTGAGKIAAKRGGRPREP